MYKQLCLTIILTLFLRTVRSHGGHSEGLDTKNAIQDALLSYLCRGANGFPCNGHGSCSSGMCTCYSGYSGLKCEKGDSSSDTINFSDVISGMNNNVGGINLHDLLSPATNEPTIISCVTNDESSCSGNGFCHEGSCLCQPGYSGLTCELSQEVGFCKTYKECAECTAFMNPCPEKCSIMANFNLVFGFPKDHEGRTFRKCRFRNSDHNCTFYFKEESESPQGVKNIMVKACLAYQEATTNTNDTLEQLKDVPLQPDTSSRPSTSSDDVDNNSQSDSHVPQKEDPHKSHIDGSTSDAGKQNTYSGDSGTGLLKPEVLLLVGSVAIVLHF